MLILGEHNHNYSSFRLRAPFIYFMIHDLPSIICFSPQWHTISLKSDTDFLWKSIHTLLGHLSTFVPRVIWLIAKHFILHFRTNHTVIPCHRPLTCGPCHLYSVVSNAISLMDSIIPWPLFNICHAFAHTRLSLRLPYTQTFLFSCWLLCIHVA